MIDSKNIDDSKLCMLENKTQSSITTTLLFLLRTTAPGWQSHLLVSLASFWWLRRRSYIPFIELLGHCCEQILS